RQGLRLGARSRGALGLVARGARERAGVRLGLAAPASRAAADPGDQLPTRSLDGARGPHPVPARGAQRAAGAVGGTVTAPVTAFSPVPPQALSDVLTTPRGSVLVLGHVTPAGDVL